MLRRVVMIIIEDRGRELRACYRAEHYNCE